MRSCGSGNLYVIHSIKSCDNWWIHTNCATISTLAWGAYNYNANLDATKVPNDQCSCLTTQSISCPPSIDQPSWVLPIQPCTAPVFLQSDTFLQLFLSCHLVHFWSLLWISVSNTIILFNNNKQNTSLNKIISLDFMLLRKNILDWIWL